MTPEEAEQLQAAAAALARAVEGYLDRPGCNAVSRQTAMAKLRWALDQFSLKVPGGAGGTTGGGGCGGASNS